MRNELSISIVIPTFNESEDIEKTLDACVVLDYPSKEIIVVDDSFDNTADIVKRYAGSGVRLIKRAVNTGGRCGARNDGIRAAKGDIVVILNADVILPPDFIRKIMVDYEAGADYVLVNAEVANQDKLFPRFVEAIHRRHYRGLDDYRDADWTEGFSCRREAAMAAGLFPTPPFKLMAGEDGFFSQNLKKLGYKKTVDLSITVKHYVVHRFRDFWRIEKERVSSVTSFFLDRRSFGEIFVRAVVRTALTVLSVIFIVPMVFVAVDLSRFSSRHFKDVPGFIYAYVVQKSAFIYGKWDSLWDLGKYLIGRGRRLSRDIKV